MSVNTFCDAVVCQCLGSTPEACTAVTTSQVLWKRDKHVKKTVRIHEKENSKKKTLLMPMCIVVGVAKIIDQIINIEQLESQPSKHSATTLLPSQLGPNHLITGFASQFQTPKPNKLVISLLPTKENNIPIQSSSTSTNPPAKVHPLKLTGIVGESGNRMDSPA
jgi:hypothetical protein